MTVSENRLPPIIVAAAGAGESMRAAHNPRRPIDSNCTIIVTEDGIVLIDAILRARRLRLGHA